MNALIKQSDTGQKPGGNAEPDNPAAVTTPLKKKEEP